MIDPHLRHLTVRVDELRHHPDNARQGDVGAISESLSRFGQVRPIVVQASTGYVIAGNHVLAAARALGEPEIAAVRVDLDDAEALAYLVADNRTADLATYDLERQADVLRQLAQSGRLEGTGYDGEDVDRTLADLARDAAPTPIAEPPIPQAPANPSSLEGEVYRLGPHRLICGDSTDPETLERLLEGERVAAVITDPPYAIYGSATGLSASVSDDGMVRPFFLEILRMAQRATVEFAQVYVCCDWRSWPSWWEMAKRTALEPKNLIVWDKGSSGLGNNWANTYELVGYFVHMPPQLNMRHGGRRGMRPVLRPNVVRHNRVTGDERQHNAAKPRELMADLITAATDPGDAILDPFGGSGTTLLAAEAEGRRCLMVERDPALCDVIRRRYADLVGVPDPGLDRGAAGAGEAEPRGEEVPA